MDVLGDVSGVEKVVIVVVTVLEEAGSESLICFDGEGKGRGEKLLNGF